MVAPEKEERAILEAIRRGAAPTIVKRQASRGTIPVSTDELLEILVFLTSDPDPTCSEVAKQTLSTWPVEKCAAALAEPQTSAEALAYYAHQKEVPEALVAVIAAHPHAGDEALTPLAKRLSLEQVQKIVGDGARLETLPGLVVALRQRTELPAELRSRLESLGPEETHSPEELEAALSQEEEHEAQAAPEKKRERVSITQKVSRMSMAERVQYAVKGEKEARLILIRDPSKVVYRAVLQSPKLSDSEIETFATMKNVAEEVLRIISMSRQFMKSYTVAKNLANNPRTPIDVSLGLINRLNTTDLKFLGLNRNVPETVRNIAIKTFKQRTETKKGPGGGH